jgi:hypothetical protein
VRLYESKFERGEFNERGSLTKHLAKGTGIVTTYQYNEKGNQTLYECTNGNYEKTTYHEDGETRKSVVSNYGEDIITKLYDCKGRLTNDGRGQTNVYNDENLTMTCVVTDGMSSVYYYEDKEAMEYHQPYKKATPKGTFIRSDWGHWENEAQEHIATPFNVEIS